MARGRKKKIPKPTTSRIKDVPMEDESMKEYEIKDAARTLLEAEKIRGDKKMMEKVLAHLDEQKSAITSIQGLRDHANKLESDS